MTAGEMKGKKLTLREVRIRMAILGMLTVRELADRIGCTREAVYYAVQHPHRYPRVYQKLLEVLR